MESPHTEGMACEGHGLAQGGTQGARGLEPLTGILTAAHGEPVQLKTILDDPLPDSAMYLHQGFSQV